MQLRTSFFNFPAFRKNLTRFAPAWVLYTLCLLMGTMLLMNSGPEYWFIANLGDCIQVMPAINLCYALLTAQLLFGDLYNSRMCNALHAMPLRRECWFVTNVVSGLVFSLLPTLIMTVISLVLSSFSLVTNAWQAPLLWMLGVNLQYICFFGIAVLSALCVGNRFSMALVYGILNYAATLVYFFAETIYVPNLYGVYLNFDNFKPWFPGAMMADLPYLECEQIWDENPVKRVLIGGTMEITGNWWYLWLLAAVGLLCIGLALLLYRKRKLECAGDFIAVPFLSPVFLLIYSMTVSAVFQLFFYAFSGTSEAYFVLCIGLAVGWFTGKMMLARTTRVFRGKNWLGLGALILAVMLSILTMKVDLFGIERWVPEAEDVESISISQYLYYDEKASVTEQEDIENILQLHALALENRTEEEIATSEYYGSSSNLNTTIRVCITYFMKEGGRVTRYYPIRVDSEEGEIAKTYLSRLQVVLGEETLEATSLELRIDGYEIPTELCSQEDLQELLDAIEADCAEGNLAQNSNFHEGNFREWEGDSVSSLWLCIETFGGEYYGLDIYADSTHTVAWMEEHGILEYILENISK